MATSDVATGEQKSDLRMADPLWLWQMAEGAKRVLQGVLGAVVAAVVFGGLAAVAGGAAMERRCPGPAGVGLSGGNRAGPAGGERAVEFDGCGTGAGGEAKGAERRHAGAGGDGGPGCRGCNILRDRDSQPKGGFLSDHDVLLRDADVVDGMHGAADAACGENGMGRDGTDAGVGVRVDAAGRGAVGSVGPG